MVWVVLCAVSTSAWATDNFPGTTLSGSSGTQTSSNVGATSETGEPAGIGGGNVNSIWYSWTAPSTGTALFGTCNLTAETTTNFDTTLHVYTGAAVNALTAITSNDDTTGCNSTVNANYGSWVQFAATSGTTYRIRVDGYASNTGGYVMRWGLRGGTVAVTDASATEGGDTATFTVVLNAPPAGSNTVTVAIGSSGQCTFSPTSLSFNSANFTTPQTVTITATNDAVAEGTHSCSPASITATGTGYTTTTITAPTLTVYDNDNPSFTIAKSVSSASIAAPGTLTYTITVDNNGSAILTGLSISDALTQNGSARTLTSGPTLTSGDSNSDGILQDTETWIYSATYAVTQANIDTGGSFSNTATFDTAETAPQTSPAAVTTITQSPAFTNVKTQTGGSNPVTAAGQTLNYTIAIDNTGNVTLTSPAVVSDTFQLGGAARTLTAAPAYSSGDTDGDGAIDVTEIWLYSASYTVTQADMDATGSFTNTLTYDTAQTAPVASAVYTTPVTRTATFTIVKGQSGGPDPVTAQGQSISWLITIDNTGNQSLTGLSLTDALNQAGSPRTLTTGPTYSSGDTDSDGAIDPDEIWLYSASYTVQLSDMNNGGSFSNTATLDTAQTAALTSAAETTAVTQTATLSIVKSFVITTDTGTLGEADVGDIITYTYDVTNTGNVTVTNVSVSDSHSGTGSPPVPSPALVASLVPAATTQFTATYQVTQGDIDAQ
jgi:uncharacterized repeat protein (TIGR01451 family)